MRLGTAPHAGRKREMSQPLQGTIKPRRPTRLVAADLHWLWWLNVRSLNLLDQGLAEVPYLWPEEDGKRLRLYLEPVSEEEGMSVWSYTNPIDHSATLMVLLAKAEDEFPDFDPERPPKTPMSPHLRWAVQRALEDHALRRIVCYPRAKSVSVQCELQGWDGRWFDRSELYTRGVHQDAGLDLHAVALAGELPDLHMREGPLPDVLEWLTYAAASYECEDWTPWDGDERAFTAKWTRGPRGVWRRWLRIY